MLYAPLALFYLKVVSRQDIPGIGFWDVARSVLIFLGELRTSEHYCWAAFKSTQLAQWVNTAFQCLDELCNLSCAASCPLAADNAIEHIIKLTLGHHSGVSQ